MGATCRPLGVEVYQLADTGILDDWTAPSSPRYRGLHGMKMPARSDDGSVGL